MGYNHSCLNAHSVLLGKQLMAAQVQVLCHHVGNLDEAPDFWLQPGTILVAAIREANKWMEVLSISSPPKKPFKKERKGKKEERKQKIDFVAMFDTTEYSGACDVRSRPNPFLQIELFVPKLLFDLIVFPIFHW